MEWEYEEEDDVLENAWWYIITGYPYYIEEITNLIEIELVQYPELLELRKEFIQKIDALNITLGNFEQYLMDLVKELQEEYLILVFLDKEGT